MMRSTGFLIPHLLIVSGAIGTFQNTSVMDTPQQDSKNFSSVYAKAVAKAFRKEGVDYLFIGKSAAIILGFPGTTQDVDLFLPKGRDNACRVISALRKLGFDLSGEIETAILDGKDFIQIRKGPFQLDLIHAPDGIRDYQSAKERFIHYENLYPIASLRDIIASKRASGRAKDLVDLEFLEEFRKEYERAHPVPLRSARQRAVRTLPGSHPP